MSQEKCEFWREKLGACNLKGILVTLAIQRGRSVAQGGVDDKGETRTLCDEGGAITCWARTAVFALLEEEQKKYPARVEKWMAEHKV
ncbi:MAG: hypothetical protein K9L85_01660 [Candidatus Peribacteraceae bacterium]|nr:hypothetical protein [Candidatus Peribacteraceae bacterium]